jgi:hypothetical protein
VACFHNLLAVVERLSTLPLKFAHELINIRVLELLVDAGSYAPLLGDEGASYRNSEQKDNTPNCDSKFCVAHCNSSEKLGSQPDLCPHCSDHSVPGGSNRKQT